MSTAAIRGLVRPERRGPAEGEHTIGVDLPPERRPGVPLEGSTRDEGTAARRPLVLQEAGRERTLHRRGLDGPTPVFGTAQPHRGVSGSIRRSAYGVPEHYPRHWMLLLLADRLDVAADRLGGALARPLEAAGATAAAERVRARPLFATGVALGAVWLAARALR